ITRTTQNFDMNGKRAKALRKQAKLNTKKPGLETLVEYKRLKAEDKAIKRAGTPDIPLAKPPADPKKVEEQVLATLAEIKKQGELTVKRVKERYEGKKTLRDA